MNSTALITMVLAMGIVSAFTFYFFFKVLRTPSKPESEEHTIPPIKSYDAT